MRRITFAALAALSCGAFAQSGPEITDWNPTNASLRAGVNIPVDSGLSNLGNTLIAAGVDYRFGRPLFASGESYASLDYFAKNLKFQRGSVMPLAVNHRFYFGQCPIGSRTYGFLGVGVAFIDYNDSNTVAMARGGIGAELGDAIFFEATGYISDQADGARANSFAFYLGYRF
jgi:hypothetical protein